MLFPWLFWLLKCHEVVTSFSLEKDCFANVVPLPIAAEDFPTFDFYNIINPHGDLGMSIINIKPFASIILTLSHRTWPGP